MIAGQVALSSNTAVEDSPRDATVISNAVKEGEAKGLNQTLISISFKAQIEASKVVQYSLLVDLHRHGARSNQSRHHRPARTGSDPNRNY
ncbi:MAG: chorismate mutase [Edaphobacter sp.]|nr:chorismate mutase [Edaphobacter sp.]